MLATAKEVFTSFWKKRERKLSGEGGNDFTAVLGVFSVEKIRLLVLPGVCSGALILSGLRPDQRCLDILSDFGPRFNSIRLLSVEIQGMTHMDNTEGVSPSDEGPGALPSQEH